MMLNLSGIEFDQDAGDDVIRGKINTLLSAQILGSVGASKARLKAPYAS